MTRPPDERDLELAVVTWMREEAERPADRNRQVGRIMGRVDETPQRRRAWSLLPFRRRTATVDEADEELVPVRGGVTPSLLAAAAILALVATSVALLSLLPTTTPPTPAGSPSPSPMPTMDPADQALHERLKALWAGGAPDLSDVLEVYAEDAVHTALWQDAVDRVKGPSAMRERILASSDVEPGEWVRALDAANGEHRYLGASANLNGLPCVFWVEDERITRQDCILPLAKENGTPFTPGEPPSDVSRETLQEQITAAWSHDREAFDTVVAPDIVHRVAFNDHAVTHKGSAEYWQVANVEGMSTPKDLAPAIDLAAPEGERRWTDFSDVGGGTLCVFWARGDQLIRHDCIVPTYTSNGALPQADEPSPAPSPA